MLLLRIKMSLNLFVTYLLLLTVIMISVLLFLNCQHI